MNIGADIQAEMLFRSFKATSIPEEIPEIPPPTPGDVARGVAADIDLGRDEAVVTAEGRAKELWQADQQQKEAPQ
jgi:hypothetical protein